MNRNEQKLLTRKKLLETSLSLFLEKGYENVSVDAIVKAAGVTKGAFYHHFLSKEAILIEYNNKILEALIEGLLLIFHTNRAKKTPEMLEHIFSGLISFLYTNFNEVRFLVRESSKTNISIREIFNNEVAIIIKIVLDSGLNTGEYSVFAGAEKLSKYITTLLAEEFISICENDTAEAKNERMKLEYKEILHFVLNGIFL